MADPAPQNDSLRTGQVLGGKYRLEKEIGRGAMGTVWSAIHESLQQRVAIKVISQEHAASEELTRRFDTEARAAAKLRSRFVVGVSDNGLTDAGLPYIVMEYLEGECLEDRIARMGSIRVPETARIARHVSRALGKAHARGIVHRDLKPANIFISRSEDEDDGDDWTAKVLDFGIAKMDDFGDRSTTKTGTVLGTPLFMSPEQVRGASNVDSRADLYSFGMVIYNMLTGTYAFEGQSFGDLLVSICTDPLPDLSRSAPLAPPAVNTWFQKACARDPADRYQTAEEMMEALAEAIGPAMPSRQSYSDTSGAQSLATLAAASSYQSDSFPASASYSGTPSSGGPGSNASWASSVPSAPSSEVSSSGIVTAGGTRTMGASDTVIAAPPLIKKKSMLPLALGGGVLALTAAIFMMVSSGRSEAEGGHEAVGAVQEVKDLDAGSVEVPTPMPEIEQATVTPEKPDTGALGTDTTAEDPQKPQSKKSKAAWHPPPTKAPDAVSPEPAPEPAPKPKAGDPDLGF